MEPERPLPRRVRAGESAFRQGFNEFLTLLLIAGAPALFYAAAFGSSWFRLQDVSIQGKPARVSAAWVEAQLAPFRDQNLLSLSLQTISTILSRHPWVDSIHLRKELPDRLSVQIRERQAAALLFDGRRSYVFVDAAGRLIAPADPADGLQLQLLQVHSVPPEAAAGAVKSALRVREDLVRTGLEWSARLRRVESLGEGSFRLFFEGLPFSLLVTAEQVADQVRGFLTILPELQRRYDGVESVDLRFRGEAVIRFARPL